MWRMMGLWYQNELQYISMHFYSFYSPRMDIISQNKPAIRLTKDAASNEHQYPFDIGLKRSVAAELYMTLYSLS